MDATNQTEHVARGVKRGMPPKVAAVLSAGVDERAQALAIRIWEGQSPDVAIAERVARIKKGLEAQGLPCLIDLPHPDAGRYL